MHIPAPITRSPLTAQEFAAQELHYRSTLSANPNHAETYYRFGMMKHYAGFSVDAVPLLQKAISLAPNQANYDNDLGIVFASLGNMAAATQHFKDACVKKPNYAEAHRNLGEAYLRQGDPVAAIAPLQQAVAIHPSFAAAHNSLGCAFLQVGKQATARDAFKKSLLYDANNADAKMNLITSLMGLRQYQEVVEHSIPFLRQRSSVQVAIQLATALSALGRYTDSLSVYKELYSVCPESPAVLAGLQIVYGLLRRYGEAIQLVRLALQNTPGSVTQMMEIMFAQHLHFAGEREESRILIQRLLTQPLATTSKRFLGDFTNFALLSDPNVPPTEVFKSLAAAGARLEEQAGGHPQHTNLPVGSRRLRIGYVSGDFKDHPVPRFFLPLLKQHDKSQFEIFAYYSSDVNDSVTAEISAFCDHWRECTETSVSAIELASLIRSDAIDILIDLSGISANNRLDAFAHKPAPVQMTWIGMASSTGLRTIDYRICDEHTDPPGMTEQFHTEELIRLPGQQAPLVLSEEYPDVSPLPSLQSSIFTFGSLNSTYKLNPSVAQTWSRILMAVPESRLLVCGIDSQETQLKVQALFAKFLPDLSKLSFQKSCPRHEFFGLFSQVDISLDPFPYNAGTTTMHSLMMGVPVITVAGNSSVSRSGVVLLNTAGLPQLVANSLDEYVDIAVDLAKNRSLLSDLRNSLRARIATNPQNDPAFITRNLEAAYRKCWTRWCAEQTER